jgi:hypothetical protein
MARAFGVMNTQGIVTGSLFIIIFVAALRCSRQSNDRKTNTSKVD